VQFHPEFSAAVTRTYIMARRAVIAAEGLDVDALLAATRDSQWGSTVLRRFAELSAAVPA
jgi:hypothetical protein